MQNCKFKFSVVIPIYNVEKYLSETIESVIKQDIGFKKNIQIILVNDGSPDNSKDICLRYKELYPDNIIYVEQENAGVSAARNTGTKYVEGKYINYLDSDDKWELNVFSKVYKMFEKNEDIDVIGVRQKFFEAAEGYHVLDYKFSSDRIVNISKEYNCLQLNLSSGFFRRESLQNKQFDTRVKYAEDVKLLFEIILEKEKYGIISSSVHFYRKRLGQTSAIQQCKEDVTYYTNTIEYVIKYLCTLSKKKYGRIIPYLQYFLIYELRWRVFSKLSSKLSEEEKKKYINDIIDILKLVEDKFILELTTANRDQKVYLMNLKYHKDIRKELVLDKGQIKYKNMCINHIKNHDFCEICIMDIKDGYFYIEGKIKEYYLPEDYQIYFEDNRKNVYNIEKYSLPTSKKISFLNEEYSKSVGFKTKIPISNIKHLRVMIDFKGNKVRVHTKFNKLSRLEEIKNMYVKKSNYIISINNDDIYITKYTKKKKIKKEIMYCIQLLKLGKINIILYRLLYYLLKITKKKPIWIISDRRNIANDNGLHLFKYISTLEHKYEIYYTIDRKTKDYREIKKIGKVLAYDSLKYKLYFLMSSCIISSQADRWVINAFKNEEKYLVDLYKFKFIFLQHGITKDDISSWLHKLNKNISLFVTAANKEYESILNGTYGYCKDEVKLTGFPRFDNLENKPKKQIIFMPTWRASLIPNTNKITGEYEYNDSFKKSDYCIYYNKLINDTRIIDTLKKHNYTGKFCIHPTLINYIKDFKGNEYIKIETENEYQKEFAENNLLITDFSSVVFDFAYLRKPVIYTQFDVDGFYEGQVYNKGYFNYEKDGFGPICYDYESTVQTIIKYIEDDCKIENKYLERIDNFYAYNDKNNCKRVYNEILKI